MKGKINKKEYFNELEFQNAMRLFSNNHLIAKERFENYIEKYPHDCCARIYYTLLLILLCEFDKAETEYNVCIQEAENGKYNKLSIKKLRKFKHNLIIAQAKLLSARHKYQELFELLKNNKEHFEAIEQNYIYYFCSIKLNYINEDCKRIKSYRFKQCYDYSIDAFFEHVKKHQVDCNEEIELDKTSTFVSGFDTKKIIEEVKKYVPSNDRLFKGYFEDIYYFRYDNCGHTKYGLTDYFKVICFHDTNQFITMCPVRDCNNIPCIDLNYLQPQTTQVKRLGQIDKFNKRFKMGD